MRIVPTYEIPSLPIDPEVVETKQNLRLCAEASRALAEMKGDANRIPNRGILIDTLALQEARSSSEIENIITTQEALFQGDTLPADSPFSAPQKEVYRYSSVLKQGYDALLQNQKMITNGVVIDLFQGLLNRSDQYRNIPGTALKNPDTDEIVYVPPQNAEAIRRHMDELVEYINCDVHEQLDPLIKMAIIHHQFESIHPFADGNGRIGRIINILFLVKMDLIDIPILYLSREITNRKAEYYDLLQKVRDNNAWSEWVRFMLEVIRDTAIFTRDLILKIDTLMRAMKEHLRTKSSAKYSHELINSLFITPYSTIKNLAERMDISRQTASKYLNSLADEQVLGIFEEGNQKYFINLGLYRLLMGKPD